MLAVLVILGGSLSVLAGNLPVRAQIYATVEQGGSQSYRTLSLYPLGDALFALNPTEDLQLCTYLRLYFVFDSDSISSFHIHLSRHISVLQDSNSGLNSFAIALYKWTNGNLTQYQSIVSEVQTERVIGETSVDYDWIFTTSTPYAGRNCVSVTIPFQSFLWNHTQRFLFSLDAFSFNGEQVGLTPLENDVSEINGVVQDDSTYYQPSSEIPSPDATHIGDGGSFASSTLNEKLSLFDLSGAVRRTLVPIGTYLFTPNSFDDSSAGHTAIVAISTISMALLVIVWIINSLHRSRGWIE